MIHAEDAQPILQVRNLARSFGLKKVHRNLSFDLYCGEILAFMGSSGSGKSLLLKTLVGLTMPDAGQIIFDQQNLCAFDEDKFRHIRLKIGFVFQRGALFNSLTVEENLSYPLKLHTQFSAEKIHHRVNERLKLMDLEGSNDLYPDELSGGMERRVGLLRATMLDPPIVLLDEPTAGLDPIHVALFIRTLKQFKKERGFTGIFVTHDVECAFAVSDRIALMNEGSIYAIGKVVDMRQSKDPWIHSFLFPNFGENSHEIRTA
jgi:phospholipid/cholesterol/gamma-HCH transport system ATP-binding protein